MNPNTENLNTLLNSNTENYSDVRDLLKISNEKIIEIINENNSRPDVALQENDSEKVVLSKQKVFFRSTAKKISDEVFGSCDFNAGKPEVIKSKISFMIDTMAKVYFETASRLPIKSGKSDDCELTYLALSFKAPDYNLPSNEGKFQGHVNCTLYNGETKIEGKLSQKIVGKSYQAFREKKITEERYLAIYKDLETSVDTRLKIQDFNFKRQYTQVDYSSLFVEDFKKAMYIAMYSIEEAMSCHVGLNPSKYKDGSSVALVFNTSTSNVINFKVESVGTTGQHTVAKSSKTLNKNLLGVKRIESFLAESFLNCTAKEYIGGYKRQSMLKSIESKTRFKRYPEGTTGIFA